MKFVFDSYVLDVLAKELRDGSGVVQVEPKVFDLLLHLIENRHRVVSKDDLVESVWQGRFIADSTIATAVKAARRAIGDDGSGQRYIKTMHGRGFRFVGDVVEVSGKGRTSPLDHPKFTQEIRYCRSADGTRIAYAIAGSGPPLVKASNWLHHLEFDWESPVWRHLFEELTRTHTLIRYDSRGSGLSQEDASDFTFERQVEDLESVVNAAGHERFSLFGLSQGAAKAIAYAARHKERVEKLVILGGYARGWRKRKDQDGRALREASLALIRAGWRKDNPAVRQMFTSLYMPDAPADSQQWFSDLQRITATAENAWNALRFQADVDVSDLLPQIAASTLVIHARHDAGVPLEEGQDIAASIPGARFAVLDTSNHILPASDPAWPRCARLIQDFLSE